MNRSSSWRVVFSAAMGAVLSVAANGGLMAKHHDWSGGTAARMATFESSTGQTSFAMSLLGQWDTPSTAASDVVIFVDTSASQTGMYKRDSLAVVEQLLQQLNKDDRVRIYAVDIDPVPIVDRWVAPHDAVVEVALEKLSLRAPLGTTDMASMFRAASQVFESSAVERHRNVIYVGDGISRGGLLHDKRLVAAVEQMVEARIAFSAYAIGPQRDIELLAALANQLGGNLYVDSDDENAVRQGAQGLAATCRGQVFWPKTVRLPDLIAEVYPKRFPPLRSDRDTILIGELKKRGQVDLEVIGELNGRETTFRWSIQSEPSSEDFAFLPKLIEMARGNGGLTLPTVGSAGLLETARVLSLNARTLSQLGAQAVLLGDVDAARVLAEEAAQLDPASSEVKMLQSALQRVPKDAAATTEQDDHSAVQDPERDQDQQDVGQQDQIKLIGDETQQQEIDRLIRDSRDVGQNLSQSEDERIRFINERIRAQVAVELTKAREDIRTDPASAIDRLKAMIDILDQTVDVLPSTRQDLRNRLETSLKTAQQRKLEFDARIAEAQRVEASRNERERLMDELQRREDRVAALINRFDTLLKEGNHLAAEAVALDAYQTMPESPEANLAYISGRIIYNARLHEELTRRREVAFVESLYQSDRAATPFTAEPPLVFPDAETWHRNKRIRAKYREMRINPTASEMEEFITMALNQPVDLPAYDNVPLSDILDDIRRIYRINIELDKSARDDEQLTESTLIQRPAIRGVRLKTYLARLLEDKNCTFVVKDEALTIISNNRAGETTAQKAYLYSVGDIVAPRRNFGVGLGGGGFGGGFGGGMGGFGGGMGGFGGGLGGFGGGMGGFGGGGGFFCIQDDVTVETNKSTAQHSVSLADQFAQKVIDEEEVRGHVRALMDQKQYVEIIRVITAAIEHNQHQPWMYEALGLAMQLNHSPTSDIERALLSAVDFADNPVDVLIVADYLSKNGMAARALRLVQDVAYSNPGLADAYVMGLRIAQQLGDDEGIAWAVLGICSQAWPEHREVVKDAATAALALKMRWEKAQKIDRLTSFAVELDQALQRDCVIEVVWSGEADIDLYVEEPGGTICSRLIPRTTAGGVWMGDAFGTRNRETGETAEYYVVPQGFPGQYRVMLKKIYGQVTGNRVTVTVHRQFNSKSATSETRQLPIGDEPILVVFNLDQGRRTESLEQKQIQTIASRQALMNREIVAQRLEEGSYSGGGQGYYDSRLGAGVGLPPWLIDPRVRARLGFNPKAVGYQPIVQPIPVGTFPTINYAVTSDRMHVVVSLAPSFSAIRDIFTFNFLGGAGNASGLGGGGLGGLGGGLGGLGGGLGGGGLGGGLF